MYKDVQRSIVQNSKIMKNPDVYYQEKEHFVNYGLFHNVLLCSSENEWTIVICNKMNAS